MGMDSESMLISVVNKEGDYEGFYLLMDDNRVPAGAKLC